MDVSTKRLLAFGFGAAAAAYVAYSYVSQKEKGEDAVQKECFGGSFFVKSS
jgi:hypothetical protein